MSKLSKKSVKVWVLTDNKSGSNSQALGVAKGLGIIFSEKVINYTSLHLLAPLSAPFSLIGISQLSRMSLVPPWPDLVISAGQKTSYVARWIKRQSKSRVRLVHIMYPGRLGLKGFDLLCLPEHDKTRFISNEQKIIKFLGAPSAIDEDVLRHERNVWKDKFDSLPRPFIALLIGGNRKSALFNKKLVVDLTRRVSAVSKELGGTILVSSSRRSGSFVERILRETIPEPRHCFFWEIEKENPYIAYLALADYIIVTGDSISMCSEACATTTPVYIYELPDERSQKHSRFHEKLYDQGYARPFEDKLESWKHNGLKPVNIVCDVIHDLFF